MAAQLVVNLYVATKSGDESRTVQELLQNCVESSDPSGPDWVAIRWVAKLEEPRTEQEQTHLKDLIEFCDEQVSKLSPTEVEKPQKNKTNRP